MNQDFVRLLGVLGVAATAACSSATDTGGARSRLASDLVPSDPQFSCVDNSPAASLDADKQAPLPQFGFRTPDDQFAAISRSVPGGFAGVFFEGDHFVMTFVDPTTADASRPAIQDAFASQGIIGNLDVSKAEFRAAHWTFAQLDEWYRYIIVTGISGSGSGVTVTDIDERANTISFGVVDETSRARVVARLADLHIPCNLVTTRIQPPAQIT